VLSKRKFFLAYYALSGLTNDLTDTWQDYILSYHRSTLFSQEPIFMLATNPQSEGRFFIYMCMLFISDSLLLHTWIIMIFLGMDISPAQFPLPYCSKPNLKITYIHVCTHTYIHAYTHKMHAHTYIRIQYMHTYKYSCVHIHFYTVIY